MSQILFFFFLMARYSQRTTKAYFKHIFHSQNNLVRDKIAQIHTNTQRKVIVTSCTAENGMKLHDCAMVRSAARSVPIGLYTTSLLGVVQCLLLLVWEVATVRLHCGICDGGVIPFGAGVYPRSAPLKHRLRIIKFHSYFFIYFL